MFSMTVKPIFLASCLEGSCKRILYCQHVLFNYLCSFWKYHCLIVIVCCGFLLYCITNIFVEKHIAFSNLTRGFLVDSDLLNLSFVNISSQYTAVTESLQFSPIHSIISEVFSENSLQDVSKTHSVFCLHQVYFLITDLSSTKVEGSL